MIPRSRAHLRHAAVGNGRISEDETSEKPEQPTDLPRPAWSGVLKRTLREFNGDHLTDLAAALTYYGVLAIFPMLIVTVSVLGLLGIGHAIADQQPGRGRAGSGQDDLH